LIVSLTVSEPRLTTETVPVVAAPVEGSETIAVPSELLVVSPAAALVRHEGLAAGDHDFARGIADRDFLHQFVGGGVDHAERVVAVDGDVQLRAVRGQRQPGGVGAARCRAAQRDLDRRFGVGDRAFRADFEPEHVAGLRDPQRVAVGRVENSPGTGAVDRGNALKDGAARQVDDPQA
jgi:hypothetical protein